MRPRLLAAWACVLAACTKPAPALELEPEPSTEPSPTEPAEPEPAEPAPSEPAEPEPVDVIAVLVRDLDLHAEPSSITATLAQRWCELGDEHFRPPGPPDEEFPPRLEGCTSIAVEVHDQREREGVRATLFTLDAPLESREFVLLQAAEHAGLLALHHQLDDTTGEGSELRRSHHEFELRDLTGSPVPEWIVQIHSSGGDSYEADRCYAHDEDVRELFVCSEAATGFVCGSLLIRQTLTLTPRPEDLDECGVPAKELDKRSVEGFAQEFELGRDKLVLRTAKAKIHEPEDPSLAAGEHPLAVLFEEPLTLAATD